METIRIQIITGREGVESMSLEKDRISSNQLSVLGLLCVVGDMALVYPAAMSAGAHQDAWIAGLISIPLGLGIIKLLLLLSNINQNQTVIELSTQVLGRWIGGAVALSYLFFFLICCATYVREMEDFLATQIYEGTPGEVIRLMTIILLVYGLRLGLGTLGRAAQIFLPFFVFFLVCLFVLLLPDVKIGRIQPYMNTPPGDFLHTLLFGVFYPFGEMCVFLMVLPFVKKEKSTNRKLFISLLIGSLGLNVILFLSLTVLGVYFSEHEFYAAYILSQTINIGNFLQRLEALMATAWIISTYFKSVLFFYAFILGSAQVLKLKTYHTLIFPAAFLLFGMSRLIAKDIILYIKEIPEFWVDWDLTHALLFPLLLLLVNKIRLNVSRRRAEG
jgi:spore germination protein KB